jgi:hypothetical protein
MKKLVLSLFVWTPVLFLACGGDKPSEDELTSQLEEACKASCAAITEPGCEKIMVTKEQCEANCPYFGQNIKDQLGGFCLQEVVDFYECGSTVKYTCMDGAPFPAEGAASCVEETQAYNLCLQDVPCKKYCSAAAEAGCSAVSEEACVEDCQAGTQTVSTCSFEYQDLRDCQTKNMSCEGGKPAITGCDEQKGEYLECLQTWGDEDPCTGYCWLATDEGCATGGMEACKADCAAALTQDHPEASSCSYNFESLRSCEAKSMVCEGGEPQVKATCDDEKKQIADCLKNQDICLATCWLEEAEDCSKNGLDACRGACKTELQKVMSCEYEYQYLLECRIQQNIVCSADVSLACQNEEESYNACVTNNP